MTKTRTPSRKKRLDTRNCWLCGSEYEPASPSQKYCHVCRDLERKATRRNQSQLHQMKKDPRYTPMAFTSECDNCKLRDDCMYRVKNGTDPYCWNGSETNNRMIHLYEDAKAELKELQSR